MYFHFHPVLFWVLVLGIFVVASYEVKPNTFEFDFTRSESNNLLVYREEQLAIRQRLDNL